MATGYCFSVTLGAFLLLKFHVISRKGNIVDALDKVKHKNMEYEKKVVLFLQLVGVVCNYENKNCFGS